MRVVDVGGVVPEDRGMPGTGPLGGYFLCVPPRSTEEARTAGGSYEAKVKDLAAVVRIAAEERRKGRVVVVTNGCFDILHAGHVQNLEWAKAQGDVLVVALNSDRSVCENKGPGRPIVPVRDRAQVLAGLEAVDYVVIFGGRTPIVPLGKIKPTIWVKGRGSETHPDFPPLEKAVRAGGGRVVFAPNVAGRSTTDIVKTVLQRCGGK